MPELGAYASSHIKSAKTIRSPPLRPVRHSTLWGPPDAVYFLGGGPAGVALPGFAATAMIPLILGRRETGNAKLHVLDWAPIMFSIPQGPRCLLIALAAFAGASLPVVDGVELCPAAGLVAGCCEASASSPGGRGHCCGPAGVAHPSSAFEAPHSDPEGGCSCRSGQSAATVLLPNAGISREPTGSSREIAATAAQSPPPASPTALAAHPARWDSIPGLPRYLWISRLII